MSRPASPCRAGHVSIVAKPFQIEGKTRLRFGYHTSTGLVRTMEVEVDVRDVLCIHNTIKSMKAEYKRLAQELADKL